MTIEKTIKSANPALDIAIDRILAYRPKPKPKRTKRVKNEETVMVGRRRQVPGPNGSTVEGSIVNVQETTERWTDVRLVDGTTFRIKVSVSEVVRLDDQWDKEGNPVYSVSSNTVIDAVESVDIVKHMRGT